MCFPCKPRGTIYLGPNNTCERCRRPAIENNLFTKISVALTIRHPSDLNKVLLVRRPPHDKEFPQLWGLPAASCHVNESTESAAHRIGPEKLGAPIFLGLPIGKKTQQRATYIVDMTLYEAWLDGNQPLLPVIFSPISITMYDDWKWDTPSSLMCSANQGSLCSQILIDATEPQNNLRFENSKPNGGLNLP